MSQPSPSTSITNTRSSEPDRRKHVCARCARAFARREHLTRHERSHTKEQPFRCPICPQAFTRRDLLTRHNRLSHQAVGSSHEPAATAANMVMRQEAHDAATVLNEIDIQSTRQQLTNVDLLSGDEPSLSNAPLPGHYFDNAFLDDSSIVDAGFLLPSHDELFSHCSSNPLPPFDFAQENAFTTTWPTYGTAESVTDHAPFSPQSDTRVHLVPGLAREPSGLGIAQHDHVSSTCMEGMVLKLRELDAVIPSERTLPSRHVLNRFLRNYMRGFHKHYPILHLASLRLNEAPVELVLAMAALGAQYSLERAAGFELFYWAKDIALQRHFRQQQARSRLSRTDQEGLKDSKSQLHAIQTFLLLMASSMWSKDAPSSDEALSLRGILERLVNQAVPEDSNDAPTEDWAGWIKAESVRRVRLVVFCFFNLQTLLFDIPPAMLAHKLHDELPCSEEAWEASSAGIWRKNIERASPHKSFSAIYTALFAGPSCEELPLGFSPLAAHGMIHAIIQRIWLLRQTASPTNVHNQLADFEVSSLEMSLERWQATWERDTEASPMPLDGQATMNFTSVALFRLAHTHVHLNFGMLPDMMASWDPGLIAMKFLQLPAVARNTHTSRVALNCAHGLSIPVRLGINFVSRTQVFFYSNQYALCSLRSALYLTKWLEIVQAPHQYRHTTPDEVKVLEFLAELLDEADSSFDAKSLLTRTNRLAAALLRLHGKIFRDDSIWEFIGLIGSSLNAYADLLEQTDMQQEFILVDQA
ncbi:hypothetical protein Q7P37_010379 [Cladosporium fusiforme]